MKRRNTGEVGDLVPAGKSGGHDQTTGGALSNGRQESPFADRPRNVVVLVLVSERAGHPATAAVEIGDGVPRDLRQEAHGRSRADQRLLMAMGVQQNLS